MNHSNYNNLAFTSSKLRSSSSGFTLIELLVVLGIMGILATLGLSSVSEIRKSVYRAANETVALDAYKSVQGGMTDSDALVLNTYAGIWKKGGLVSSVGDPDLFAPGVKTTNNYLSILFHPLINSSDCPMCPKIMIYTRQCGSNEGRFLWEFANGEQWASNVTDNWSCS